MKYSAASLLQIKFCIMHRHVCLSELSNRVVHCWLGDRKGIRLVETSASKMGEFSPKYHEYEEIWRVLFILFCAPDKDDWRVETENEGGSWLTQVDLENDH